MSDRSRARRQLPRITLPGWKIALFAMLSTALAPFPAHAYRPFDLTDAEVAKRHNFEIALGPAELIGVGAEHSLQTPNLSINYGVAKGKELSLEGVNRVAFQPEPGEPHTQLEDVGVMFKGVMRRGSLQDEKGPSLAMEGGILFPARGEAHLGASAAFLASSESKHGTTHFNIEGEREPEGRNAGSMGVIFEAGDKFGLAPGMELRLAVANGGLPEQSAIVGLIYVPGEQTEYDVALRLAHSGDENTFEIRAGLTFQFSRRKALEEAEKAVGITPPRRRRH